jgi:hypothetical protein
MSMTISAANYFSNIHQNTRTSGEEKQEQKGATADVGKTQQSSVSASLDQVNMGQDGVAITEVSRQQGVEQSVTQKQPAAPRMDTVEISDEGRAASAQLQGQQTEAAAETEQAEVEDLSEYTDTELKQMYYKGEITRQEYEDETGEVLE